MAANKISLEELNAKLLDPTTKDSDLAGYFTLDEERSRPFNPVLKINPQTVSLPKAEDALQRSAALLNSANYIARLKRQIGFNNRVSSGNYRGPILVSEGDSWFQYPVLLEDVIDQLLPKYAIFSLDAAGDTLSNMLKEKEYLKALKETGASIFLFSGGGNDVVAGGNLAAHLRHFDSELSAAGHLKPSFNIVLDEAIGLYSKLVREVASVFPKVESLCHGYDYTIPAEGKWLGQPMISKNITDKKLQAAIAKVMIDRFNERLLALSRTSARLHYVDCRNTVGLNEWHDELHPTDVGYAKVAKKFQTVIEQIATRPRDVDAKTSKARAVRSVGPTAKLAPSPGVAPSLGARAEGGPRGISLHVGLNLVDPVHYAGWDGELAACEFDATDMREIADGLGYESTLLLTADATRKALVDHVTKAANTLEEGDIFFITYSGHGGQAPDFNGDEEDGVDETWCLHDGQLLDDELYSLWSLFKTGVRVMVLSDSCHSGSVIRDVVPTVLATLEPMARVRAMPSGVAARTFRQNRDFYEKLGSSMTSLERQSAQRAKQQPLSCCVKLISGCQDNQVSLDGLANGAFTAALIATWDHGRFKGDYTAFHKAILKRLPPTQSPNHWTIGAPNPVFDVQSPFSI